MATHVQCISQSSFSKVSESHIQSGLVPQASFLLPLFSRPTTDRRGYLALRHIDEASNGEPFFQVPCNIKGYASLLAYLCKVSWPSDEGMVGLEWSVNASKIYVRFRRVDPSAGFEGSVKTC